MNYDKVEDTFFEAFEGKYVRALITGPTKEIVKRAAYDSTSTPSAVIGRVEGGVEGFLEENETAVKLFLEDHKQSAEYVNENVEAAAALVVKTGIIEKEPIAKKAIPNCNITYVDGEEMQKALSGYLGVLYQKDANAVGGNLPGKHFYYLSK